jgi:hypothetical protein
MNVRVTPNSASSRVPRVKRLTPIEQGMMPNDDSLPSSFGATPTAFAAARSSTHEKLAVQTRRPPVPPTKEQAEEAIAEEQLVQELRPLARVLLIQARREIARRVREAQTKVA